MKSIFDTSVRAEVIGRINFITENSKAQWGKMNVCQMLKHCILWDEMALGKTKYKQTLLGRLIGQSVLKSFIKDETSLKKNMPTVAGFKITEQGGNIVLLKQNCIGLIKKYEHFSNFNFVHPFFGKMTQAQSGIFVYKHYDHHLRQFSA